MVRTWSRIAEANQALGADSIRQTLYGGLYPVDSIRRTLSGGPRFETGVMAELREFVDDDPLVRDLRTDAQTVVHTIQHLLGRREREVQRGGDELGSKGV